MFIAGILLFGKCPSSALAIAKGDKITFSFGEPFTKEKIAIMPRKAFMWANPADYSSTYSISSSDDGKNHKIIADFAINGLIKMVSVPFERTSAKFFQSSLIKISEFNKIQVSENLFTLLVVIRSKQAIQILFS